MGFVFVVISLGFLVEQTKFQVKQTKLQVDGLRSSSYAAVLDKQLEIHKIFLDAPKLRTYFENGIEIRESDQYYNKVISIADYHLDFFDLLWGQGDNFLSLKDDEDAWRGWQIYIGDTFNKSPALCQRLKTVSSWYENNFIEFVDDSM